MQMRATVSLPLSLGLLACGGACERMGDAPVLQSQQAVAATSTRHRMQHEELPSAASCKVRLVSANISSGNRQSYEGHAARIFQALHPSVVLVQEFNVPNDDRASFVRSTFGGEYTYSVEADSSIPNGVISRFPILAHGEWKNSVPNANRDYAWARIEMPGGDRMLAVSVHLRTKAGPRASEERELVEFINKSRQSGDVVVLGGDFNHDASLAAEMAGAAEFLNLGAPAPRNGRGGAGTNATLSKKLDLLLVGHKWTARERAVNIAGKSYEHGAVFHSDMAEAAALLPALPGDSFAPNMQHMPVVRDFDFCSPL